MPKRHSFTFFVLVGFALALGGCRGPLRAVRLGAARIEAPRTWRVERSSDHVALVAPDGQARVTIVERPGSAEATIAAGWQKVHAHGLALAPLAPFETVPPEHGWDEIASVEYGAAAPSTRRGRAVWRRFGARGFAILIDGERNALERRDAEIETIIGSLLPDGKREERLDRRPRPLEAATQRALDEALDNFLIEARTKLRVPGAAVAVIVDGRVVYERVIGVRALGEVAAITPETRFLIASITKPMTTLMQAALVDAGTLRWDSPVTELLPSFALGDAAMTRALRLWHMSCACTGMPRQDMEGLFEWDGVTPEQRLATMRTMRPTTKLGETFQYSNPMVAAGGYAAAHAFLPKRTLAEAYAAAMQAKVFAPIGMRATTLDFATVAAGDHARPHALAIDGTVRAMPLSIERAVEPIAPAGGVFSTLHDMERYAITELQDGVAPDGQRVVSQRAIRARRKIRVRSDQAGGYGLGLDVFDYAGQRALSHDGGSFGFGSSLLLLPDAKVGIVVLTNIRNGNAKQQLPFNAAIKRRVIEALFPAARPRAASELAYYQRSQRVTPRAPSADTRWVATLVGTYHHPTLGTIVVRATESGAELDAGEWRTAIDREVDADGQARLVLLDPPFAGGAIVIEDGTPPALVIPGQTTYTLTR